MMEFKEGLGWKAWNDEKNNREQRKKKRGSDKPTKIEEG